MRNHFERSTDRCCAFSHAEDPVGIGSACSTFGEAAAVVSNAEFGGASVAGPSDRHATRVGMSFHIDERFLRNSPHLAFLQDGQAVCSMASQLDGEVAAFALSLIHISEPTRRT